MFKAINSYMINVESFIQIIHYTFDNFDLLMNFIINKVGLVTQVQTPEDTVKSEVIEEILKLLLTAIKIDFLFLLSKGDQVLLEFL